MLCPITAICLLNQKVVPVVPLVQDLPPCPPVRRPEAGLPSFTRSVIALAKHHAYHSKRQISLAAPSHTHSHGLPGARTPAAKKSKHHGRF